MGGASPLDTGSDGASGRSRSFEGATVLIDTDLFLACGLETTTLGSIIALTAGSLVLSFSPGTVGVRGSSQ